MKSAGLYFPACILANLRSKSLAGFLFVGIN
jgi:hypothetical protein